MKHPEPSPLLALIGASETMRRVRCEDCGAPGAVNRSLASTRWTCPRCRARSRDRIVEDVQRMIPGWNPDAKEA